MTEKESEVFPRFWAAIGRLAALHIVSYSQPHWKHGRLVAMVHVFVYHGIYPDDINRIMRIFRSEGLDCRLYSIESGYESGFRLVFEVTLDRGGDAQ